MTALVILHIILSLIITALIFTQSSSGGLESSNILSSAPPTRRGWDKITFNLTLVILIIFLVSATLQAII